MIGSGKKDFGDRLRSILLVGPPGSGKGTLGHVLGELPGFCFLSMGEVLRSLDPQIEPGRTIHEHLRAGELVPTELAVSAWDQHLGKQIEAGFEPQNDLLVLDGVPRNVAQAEVLDPRIEMKQVIHLMCDDDEILINRIHQRNKGRADDSDDAIIRHRFQVYREETIPLLHWYPPELVASVDAKGTPLEGLCQITNVLTRANCGCER